MDRRSWDFLDNDQRVKLQAMRESNGMLADKRNGPVIRRMSAPAMFQAGDDEARYWCGLGMPDPRLSWWQSDLHSDPVMVPRWDGTAGYRRMWRVKR